MADTSPDRTQKRNSVAGFAIFCGLMVALTVALVALGLWQVERLAWKRELIARVEERVHTEPVGAPAQAEWNKVSRADDEYRRVSVAGTLENDRETLVYASTTLGPGYWVLTPLRRTDGTFVLINRGFVPTDRRDPSTRSEGQVVSTVVITGLLRITEPKGTVIRSNDPGTDRWYSRDVDAIADRRGIDGVAPYFIDADATPNPGGLPVGGLTQIAFANNHLVYAITWFVLSLMPSGLLVFVLSNESRARKE
ncbi:SURF1 family protein [Rhizobium grahamii]|uniref:SURF1-like protein n=1 Tax=Rhizobium grahamii TaxID=1120045 RepID=A0A370KK23_9HYPH|nr:SURF1 family protein [Rhizobium grahamii]RDJ06836.1 hypothetical protein B5K06_22600 [Rhizobium grahamii]